MVSAASGMLFLTPIWGRLGVRLGLRRTIIGAFSLPGRQRSPRAAGGIAALAAVLLMFGALGGTCLDAVGKFRSCAPAIPMSGRR